MDAAEIRKLGELEARHWWYAERRWLLRRLLGSQPSPNRWALDVGAAAGGNTRVLRDAGWKSLALEYSETGALLAHGSGLSVVRGDATRLPVNDASFGAIVAFDVLEHIEDHEEAAAQFFRALESGGRLFVAVPADARLWSEHDVAVGHVRRYEREELVDLINGAGFADVRVRSWNVLLRPIVALRRKTTHGSDLDDPGFLTNAFLRFVVIVERFLPVRSLPGVTLILTASKPLGVSSRLEN
ncbi:MAG: methyltransferase domain-containing protein [Actinomycetia bacterium]|nr:methyltransferase domain-containing protein [Actinomycetes bacterium]